MESKLFSCHGAFLPDIKHFEYKIGIQFNNTALVVEQLNYATKTVNDYMIYNLVNSAEQFYIEKLLVSCNEYSKTSVKVSIFIAAMEYHFMD